MPFLDELTHLPTLRRAWEEVRARRGVAGIDRVSVDAFAAGLDANLRSLADEIRSAAYRALPVLRLRPPFLAASDRALVVPAVRDRVVQRAVADLLGPRVEAVLSPACRAFRKGSSALVAADDVARLVAAGRPWVLRGDVKAFFDSIDPEILRGKVAPFVDEDGLRFLDRLLRCRVFDHDQVAEMVTGIPQGSPLSPLLGNLYLAEFDAAVLRIHPAYLRYCDDLIVLGSREEEVRQAQQEIAAGLADLKLVLNEAKTRLCRVEDGFTFLGYQFGATGRGPAAKAVEALRFRLDELAAAPEFDVGEVDALFRGWTGYFGRHPESWIGSAAGLLALLRAPADPGAPRERLVAARLRLPVDPPPALARALGAAWMAAGAPEMAWFELAAAGGRGGLPAAELPAWAEALAADAGRLGAIGRTLAGPPADRLGALAEQVAQLGRYEEARALAALAAEAGRATEPAGDEEPGAGDLAESLDAELLAAFFQGREGVHAVESVGRAGHRAFVPLRRPIAADDWRAHLRGEKTLALPLVRAGDSALLGVLDVDVERRALDDRLGRADDLLGRALAAALRLRSELARRGCASLLEASGYKGFHLWVRFAAPVPCFQLRRWLLDVIQAAGPLPEGVRVEELPNRDRVRSDQIGPLIKLPLGIHGKTGKRCDLLDDRGRPLADTFAAIRELARSPVEVVLQAVPGEAPASAATPATEALAASAASAPAGIGPRAQRMLDGCRVLGFLARRAAETSYLNHRERFSLLCTLGHLGEEGSAALHAIIGHTYNYRAEVTGRHAARLPPWPISCPKLRELHPEAAVAGSCACSFPQLRGRAYPTPVLFALRPAEVPAFRAAGPGREEAAGERAPGPSSRGGVGGSALQRHAEELVARLAELRRHQRGIDGSLRRTGAELAALFEEAGTEGIELAGGVLRRRPKSEGEGWDFALEL